MNTKQFAQVVLVNEKLPTFTFTLSNGTAAAKHDGHDARETTLSESHQSRAYVTQYDVTGNSEIVLSCLHSVIRLCIVIF